MFKIIQYVSLFQLISNILICTRHHRTQLEIRCDLNCYIGLNSAWQMKYGLP